MAVTQSPVRLQRWQGGQHPTMSNITRKMQAEGLRPYMWSNMPNHRYAIRTHGYDKILYVLEGTVEITLPDSNERLLMRAGDRLDIPAGVRHGTIVGKSGAKCVEATIGRKPRGVR